MSISPEGTIAAALWRQKIARRIDAAVRREVRYAVVAAYWLGFEDARAHASRGRYQIRDEYGVLP